MAVKRGRGKGVATLTAKPMSVNFVQKPFTNGPLITLYYYTYLLSWVHTSTNMYPWKKAARMERKRN